MHNFYQAIQLPEPIDRALLQSFTKRTTRVKNDQVNPLLFERLDALGFTVQLIEIFYSPRFFKSTLHADFFPVNAKWHSRCKINWNSSGKALSQWYDLDVDKTSFSSGTTDISTSFVKIDETSVNAMPTQTAMIDGWHLFESGTPHQIINGQPEPRWCICFLCEHDGHTDFGHFASVFDAHQSE